MNFWSREITENSRGFMEKRTDIENTRRYRRQRFFKKFFVSRASSKNVSNQYFCNLIFSYSTEFYTQLKRRLRGQSSLTFS